MINAEEKLKRAVRERYTKVANRTTSCCETNPATAQAADRIAQYGYELTSQSKNISDSVIGSFAECGNPLTIEALQPDEVVLDLGSGAGLDCFLAAQKVGPTGHVIGPAMTDVMLAEAQSNQQQLSIANVAFRKGEMKAMPIANASIDVIISNCVTNLASGKDQVFREACRKSKEILHDPEIIY